MTVTAAPQQSANVCGGGEKQAASRHCGIVFFSVHPLTDASFYLCQEENSTFHTLLFFFSLQKMTQHRPKAEGWSDPDLSEELPEPGEPALN